MSLLERVPLAARRSRAPCGGPMGVPRRRTGGRAVAMLSRSPLERARFWFAVGEIGARDDRRLMYAKRIHRSIEQSEHPLA
jgi:hypothetical protein